MAAIIRLGYGSAPTSSVGDLAGELYVVSGQNDGNGMSLQSRAFLRDARGTAQLTQAARHNYVRNGGFWFAQRQAPGSATTYSSTAGRALSADGWGITNENASATYRRIDTSGAVETGLQGRFWGEFIKTTSAGKLCVSQWIESVDAQALKNRVVRLQCWMKGVGATPTIKFGLLELQNAGTADTPPATFISAFGGGGVNPTFGTNLAFLPAVSGQIGDGGISIASNVASAALGSSWQRYGFMVTVSSNCKNLVPVFFSDQTITATQGFGLAQVSLTDGSEQQDWSPRSYQTELSRVRRFYQKTFNVDQQPVTNLGVNTGEAKGIAGKAGAVANSGFVFMRWDVPLRTGGAVTLYNPGAANALMRNLTGGADMGATTTTGNQNSDTMVNATGVAATAVGDNVAIHITSDAEI